MNMNINQSISIIQGHLHIKIHRNMTPLLIRTSSQCIANVHRTLGVAQPILSEGSWPFQNPLSLALFSLFFDLTFVSQSVIHSLFNLSAYFPTLVHTKFLFALFPISS